jgi:hypothetical protein
LETRITSADQPREQFLLKSISVERKKLQQSKKREPTARFTRIGKASRDKYLGKIMILHNYYAGATGAG